MTFSIITICLNMEKEIADTISSVLHQTSTDYEYIIKDGGSKDRTMKIANSFAPAFAEKGISYRVISLPDQGIYDAMNQSVSESCGDWINFMNAGDRFASKDILEKIVKSGFLESADVVYGDRILRKQNRYRYLKAYALEEMRVGLPFGHQSAFTRRVLFDHAKYSLNYRICSDYKFYLQLYREEKRFVYFPEAVSIYDITGVSSNSELSNQEKLQILEEMPDRDEEAIQRIHNTIGARKHASFMHQHLWRFVPKPLREKRRERMNRKAGWKTEEEFFGTKKERS